ncbi:unnamed protein product [Arabidopsis thaliana]|uniref:F-box domain-containing protein n=1 Tax=Arabidopsis thaliana TaxID=3702 RepID=A0A5S9VAU3_ARATH|nr:unnamed protein product [Arabidopsis thaliana]
MKTRRNTRSCSNSRKREEKNSETIPFDLVIEILTRLPVKSIARFRCLSKLCASTLNNPDFTESFFTISSSRPKLLFTCPKDVWSLWRASSSHIRDWKELSWRKIKCDMAHYPEVVDYEASGYPRPLYDGICINGVLYYLGRVHDDLDGFPDMVCFDIKFEKFSYIKKANGMKRNSGVNLQPTLVNHKGKIAKLQANIGPGSIRYTGIQLWVLEDAEKHQWSSYIYVVPPPWKNIIEETKLRFVGTSDTGDIVLSPCNISNSFYLLYYNPERNAIARVEIQGMEAFKTHKSYAFLDYAENIVKPKPTRKL